MSIQVDKQAKYIGYIKKPKLYSVIIYNDDITTMNFVTYILMEIFIKPEQTAIEIMQNVHKNGSGVAGVYTYDIAISKKIISDQLSNLNGFPLKLSLEEVPD